MRSTRGVVVPVVTWLALAAAVPALAQDEAALRSFFEGRRVTVRIDLPGTQEGVNVYPARNGQMDVQDYRHNMTTYPTAIHAGDTVVVTLVKVKKDLIEFQLGGGGFGTFGDDTVAEVHLPRVEESDHEKDLEKRIKKEDDEKERRRMQHELDELRDRREDQNRHIMHEEERQSAMKAQHIIEERMRGGSRFNVRYDHAVPADLTPDMVMAALAGYVDFGGAPPYPAPMPAIAPVPMATPAPPLPPPGDITALRKGMMRAEAEQRFGRPTDTATHQEGSLTITTLVFVAGQQRISADFVDDVLVRYTVTSK